MTRPSECRRTGSLCRSCTRKSLESDRLRICRNGYAKYGFHCKRLRGPNSSLGVRGAKACRCTRSENRTIGVQTGVPKLNWATFLSFVLGLLCAVVLHFMLYRISIPIKPFIYVVFWAQVPLGAARPLSPRARLRMATPAPRRSTAGRGRSDRFWATASEAGFVDLRVVTCCLIIRTAVSVLLSVSV
jgi:hypothetical protein